MAEGNENLFYPSPWDFKRSLTCGKTLQHGISGFIFHPKEGVLRIFIAQGGQGSSTGCAPYGIK
jgi:hypothetical protein